MISYQIYLWVGLMVLGLIDLYLSRYPIFHPIIMVAAAGWFWSELNTGLIVGGFLELIFGIAQLKGNRRLNLVLYAGGLAIYLNQETYNINLILCLTLGLLLALGLQSLMEPLRNLLKWLVLGVFSGAIIILVHLGRDLLGLIPAQFLSQISIAGEVLPWIFFAYAIKGLIERIDNKETVQAIPAILIGSELNMEQYIWGPIAFIILFYLFDIVFRGREFKVLLWIDWVLIVIGIYINLQFFGFIWVFAGLLGLNLLFITRNFAPLEIYLLNFIAGIILSQGGLLY
ncbi:hypothetical protein BBF96_01880 [Anoxybacter fermentans]|uniref:Uncharacterized protein n=1 Tax=Anoxybacter fermentans TaxID=1323375 RepID=A0A3Q9HNU1_9FIRM|nr:hypothetical protein [Anoxybacter fermentans]AZR72254.1 hypothetical protein BBF96_01880 [Anoxybacter fermentans]